MILVTGANGQLGGAIVQSLLGRVASASIVAVTRAPDKVAKLADHGIEVRAGDFADANGLKAAFRDVDQVLIVSADKLGDEALRLHRTAIDAARDAGARRILYTSHMGARAESPFLPAGQHAGTEIDLAASGIAFTALRHGFYAESCLHMIGDGLRSGELRTPEDGPISWTARDDLAQADAAILADDGAWDGITPPLTAADAITMAQLAAIASEATGHEVRHTTVTDEEWRDAKIAGGMSAMYADMLLGTFRAARRGDFAATDPALGILLGRPPRTMHEVLSAAR